MPEHVHGPALEPGPELGLGPVAVPVSQPASGVSENVAGVETVTGSVVEPVVEPAVEPGPAGLDGPDESERASPPRPKDSATSRSSSPYTGSQPRSYTSVVAKAFVGPWTVAGVAQRQLPFVEEASVIAKSVEYHH